MPVRPGTTGSQIEAMGRWALVGVYVIALLTWWWPGYRVWGAMSAAVMLVLVLWLFGRILAADRTVPGHPLFLVLLVPVGVLGYHLARAHVSPGPAEGGLGGILNLSMIFHLSLLAMAVFLTRALLPQAGTSSLALSLCGAAAMIGAFLAAVLGSPDAGYIRHAAALIGFSGIFVWLAPPWRFGAAQAGGVAVGVQWRRPLRVARAAVACLAAMMLTWASAPAACVAAAGAGGVAVLAGVIFPSRRAIWLLLGVGSMAVGLAALQVCGQGVAGPWGWFARPGVPGGAEASLSWWIGRGETALASLTAGDSGAAMLVATIGWGGAGLTGAGALGCLIWFLARARRESPKGRSRAAMWSAAAVLAACAMLARGGLFIPAVGMQAALAWALVGQPATRPRRRPHGVFLLAAVAALLIAMGLARRPGLAQWSAAAFGAGENFLHAPTGFLLALLLAWLMGARRFWLGLLGILMAALAGPGGEVLQKVASLRGVEREDWVLHALGCVAALVPYALCMGVRRRERPVAPRGGG